jgi:hypothetical protein
MLTLQYLDTQLHLQEILYKSVYKDRVGCHANVAKYFLFKKAPHKSVNSFLKWVLR